MEWLHLLGSGPALLLILGFIFIEETGIPIPLPGDAVLMCAGYLAAINRLPIFLFLPVAYVCAVTGAAICYGVSRKLGRTVLLKHGSKIQLTPKRVAWAEGFMNKAASTTIFVARLLPGLRINASMIAGCLNVPFKRFMRGVFLSTVVWLLGFTILGYILGPSLQPVLPWLDRFGVALLPGFALIATLEWTQRRRLRQYQVATA